MAPLVEEQDHKAFVKIIKQPGIEGTRDAANRILHPKGYQVTKLLLTQRDGSLFSGPSIAASHAISAEALDALERDDLEGFLARRHESLTTEVRRFADRMAAWEQTDRPSIEYVLAEVEADAS